MANFDCFNFTTKTENGTSEEAVGEPTPPSQEYT